MAELKNIFLNTDFHPSFKKQTSVFALDRQYQVVQGRGGVLPCPPQAGREGGREAVLSQRGPGGHQQHRPHPEREGQLAAQRQHRQHQGKGSKIPPKFLHPPTSALVDY